jgi:hypothetical protein
MWRTATLAAAPSIMYGLSTNGTCALTCRPES